MKERVFSFATEENLFNFKKAFTWEKTLQWIKETIDNFEPYSIIEWIQGLNKNELSIIKELNNLKTWHHFLLNLDSRKNVSTNLTFDVCLLLEKNCRW